MFLFLASHPPHLPKSLMLVPAGKCAAKFNMASEESFCERPQITSTVMSQITPKVTWTCW